MIELQLSASEFLDRVAALIPPPRKHRQRYFGVLAPNSPWRALVTAQAIRRKTLVGKIPSLRPLTIAVRDLFNDHRDSGSGWSHWLIADQDIRKCSAGYLAYQFSDYCKTIEAFGAPRIGLEFGS